MQVQALQFEWAWQNPGKSKWTRGLPDALKKQRMRVDKQAHTCRQHCCHRLAVSSAVCSIRLDAMIQDV